MAMPSIHTLVEKNAIASATSTSTPAAIIEGRSPKRATTLPPGTSPASWPTVSIAATIAATASEVPMIAMPMPASPQNSSSLTIGSVRPLSSLQNWASASKP